jgi:hypothetical protein
MIMLYLNILLLESKHPGSQLLVGAIIGAGMYIYSQISKHKAIKKRKYIF